MNLNILRNSILGIHPNIILRLSFFFFLSASGGGSRSPSRGEGTTSTRAFESTVGMMGGMTSEEDNDAAIEAAASMTRRGDDIAVLALSFLPRHVLRDVDLVGEPGATAMDAGDGALRRDVDAATVDGGNDPSGMEGNMADKLPLHWL